MTFKVGNEFFNETKVNHPNLRDDASLNSKPVPQLVEDAIKLISIRPELLDLIEAASEPMEDAKKQIDEQAHAFSLSPDFQVLMPTDHDLKHTMKAFPTYKRVDIVDSLRSRQTVWHNRFQQLLFLMATQVHHLLSLLYQLIQSKGKKHLLYEEETLGQMEARWRQLSLELYDYPKNKFDVSKIPTAYDYTKYDSTHNRTLSLGISDHLRNMLHTASWISSLVLSCEYGVNRRQKLQIGSCIAQPLLQHIIHRSMRQFRRPEVGSRLALYFTSESHVAGLVNLLVCSPELDTDFVVRGELNYLSHIVFKLYEDRRDNGFPHYFVDLFLSTGAEHDVFGTLSTDQHVLSVAPLVFLQRVTLVDLTTVAVPFSFFFENDDIYHPDSRSSSRSPVMGSSTNDSTNNNT